MISRWQQWLLITICLLLLQPLSAAEEILRFHSNIEVLLDSSMVVTESILVRAEGKQINRGIYRDFPTDYRDRLNNRIRVGFEVKTVTRDGLSEPFFTERYGNGVRVYIGNKNKSLSTGEYEYKITYRTTRQLGYFADHDELYWNITGNGWGFVINEASALIKLPAGVVRTDMAIEGYTGPAGSTAQDYTTNIAANNEAFIATTRSLQPGEGLTVVLSWPKGVVVEPSPVTRAGFMLADNRAVLLALVGLALMAGYLIMVWARYGRDPEAGPVFPHYKPPAKLSPGACRYIQQMSHDNECFTAAVLSLAVKGYISIHEGYTEALRQATGGGAVAEARAKLEELKEQLEDGGMLQRTFLSPMLELASEAIDAAGDDTFVLEKNDNTVGLPKLAPGEHALLKKLFEPEKYLVLTNKNHKIIKAAISAHAKALKAYHQKISFLTNSGKIFPAILLGAGVFIYAAMTTELTPLPIIIMVLAVPLLLLFAYLLKAPTLKGRKIMDQLAGFKMYLAVAEAEDLQRIEGIAGASPEKSPELFEQYLPFAVALDVEQPWADQFERLFMKISAEKGSSYRPGWYSGSKAIGSFSGFTTGLTSSLGNAISSSSTAPGSSSGSGGGGSSGGGGGGGGGGGW